MNNRTVYNSIRLYVMIGGIILMALSINHILNDQPDWEGFPAPALEKRLQIAVPFLFLGILSVLPHRWTLVKKLQNIKLLLLILLGAWTLYLCAVGLRAYIIHDKHWTLVALIFGASAFAIFSPLSVWLKSKIWND